MTLYDALYDMGVRELPNPLDNALYQARRPLHRLNQLAADYQPMDPAEFPIFAPVFEEEIQPIFT